MPIIKSAKKALRQTKKRSVQNQKKKSDLKSAIKNFKKQKKPSDLSKIYSLADKAVKTGVIHKNKAGRIKSQMSSMIVRLEKKEPVKKTVRKK